MLCFLSSSCWKTAVVLSSLPNYHYLICVGPTVCRQSTCWLAFDRGLRALRALLSRTPLPIEWNGPETTRPGLPSRRQLLNEAAAAKDCPGGSAAGGHSAPGPSLIAGYLLLPLPDREHVSRALDINTGRELRCKVFPLKHYQDKIRPYIQLPSHRNITGIVEVILGDTKAYVFFDKDFGDMHSYVRSCKRLPEQEAARLFKQIVSAVAHCHQSAIVLGDLKLRKFVFSSEERTQLRLESLEDTHIIKGEDDALSDKHGCPAYVSPEILNTTGTYSGKSADVWSLGVMLYTLLVGRYPFHDSDPSALFSKIRRGQFCIPDHVSPKARCLIRSLLRRDPSERLAAPEILLHPWFDAVLESGHVGHDLGASDQMVPENSREDDDISSFFC
ncbi:PREDICTED: tribbles homolog 1-like [Gekko japonicus]|uniref:Tribbles homolog 1-like n=1 Tax=Gekko japonicus TaxID=146911 RepID=A0ABM1KIU2_GEKJA|nr:PREDICTED: tribbles homolog 1-like [Gekko japonicus]